ncbi:hypothetical protein HN020_03125 [Brevibacillus borstelensis]|nr:hypothetical protein [Brevibacillus borstelensis]MCM3593460.1 hypothetical protein [Brevibacillus borstelensis]NOU53790.1 hypothetical protein [Brevibacillus borstelensis]
MQGGKEQAVAQEQKKAIELAKLAGSAKLGEKKVNLVEIMREVKGK